MFINRESRKVTTQIGVCSFNDGNSTCRERRNKGSENAICARYFDYCRVQTFCMDVFIINSLIDTVCGIIIDIVV
ncbi:hypothetical protein MAR_008122 [Mya arenaria]|uniref:Uncharacterized protein n=1 Tax=Mya arenaria TaxID=6604 RepID=A0ABY7DZG8_MYAAR|nr:hypothetical protein MAR_008122 [Mya arenaria]